MDGGFNAVTFICSKTDDISLAEAQESLGLEEQMSPSRDERDRLSEKQTSLRKQLKEMKKTESVHKELANDADEQIEKWEALKESVGDGKVVFAPKRKSETKKRKSNSTSKEEITKKKRKASSSDLEDSDIIEEEETEDYDDDAADNDRSDDGSQQERPLTEEGVLAKLQELKATKKDRSSGA